MKILVVTHAFPPEGIGGTERYAERAARALQDRGHEIKVLSGSIEWRKQFHVEQAVHNRLPVTRIHRSDLYFDHWDKIYNPHVSKTLIAMLDAWRPDVIHVHHWIRLSSDIVRQAANQGIPALVHLHDLFSTCPRVFRVRAEDQLCDEPMGVETCLHCVPRWTFQSDTEIARSLEYYQREILAEVKHAATVVAPSQSHAETLSRHLGSDVGPILALPHPTMTEPFAVAPGAGSPAGHLKLLFFANLNPVKGLHVLLAAMQRIEPSDSVELDVFGGFSTPEYEERIRGMLNGLTVRFHGAYEVGEPALCRVDAVVIPTIARESYSFWLDEAMLLGRPIIATDLGAIGERARGRALLVPPQDPDAIARSIVELRDRPELRVELEQSVRAHRTMDLNQHIVALEKLLDSTAKSAAQQPESLADPAVTAYEWDRREAGFQELLRSEHWETVIRNQNQQIEKLQKELKDADKKTRGPDDSLGPGPA